MERILVPVDGSPTSQKAALKAIEVAKKYNSEIIFMTAVRRPEIIGKTRQMYGRVYNLEALTEELKNHQAKILDDFVSEFELTGINIQKRVVVGTPSEEIVDMAKEVNAGLIVIGRRGYSRIKRFFVGSVSQRVISEAPCPVLVINDDQAE